MEQVKGRLHGRNTCKVQRNKMMYFCEISGSFASSQNLFFFRPCSFEDYNLLSLARNLSSFLLYLTCVFTQKATVLYLNVQSFPLHSVFKLKYIVHINAFHLLYILLYPKR